MSVRLEVSSRKMDVVALWEYYHSTLGKPTHVKVFCKWHLRDALSNLPRTSTLGCHFWLWKQWCNIGIVWIFI
jgi:hypothetical protein